MAKMTESTFATLYEFGQQVYRGEIDIRTAAEQASLQRPEIAQSSARHYILWYSKMRAGEHLTWNSNSDLLLYYARRIIEEEGAEVGSLAIHAAKQFAKHVSREDLENELNCLAAKNGIQLDENRLKDLYQSQKDAFRQWLENLENHKYTNGTIYKYIRALEMSEEWLNFRLENPILSITTYEQFDKCNQTIKALPNYVEVNRAHGNGDLSAALSLYSKFLVERTDSILEWWPSEYEYNTEINKEKWIELLNNPVIFTESALTMIAEFYAFGGEATCTQLAEHYQKTYNYYLMTSVHLAERVVKSTGCPVLKEGKNSKWWPVLYVGKNAEKEENGSYIWRIRDELREALAEFEIERHLPKVEDAYEVVMKGDEKEMTVKEKVDAIKAYIAAKGFHYEGDLIENFYLSLKSKPFVILAGTSGTGKTRLVKLFAKAIDAKIKLVPVRPDWSDSSDLFGYTDLSNEFHSGAIIDFVKQAEGDKNTPYFLCLDEMNLARVEYYLSDFLSVIETRDRNDDGTIKTDSLVDENFFKTDDVRAKYSPLYIPENLYIVGTVNMDETTFPFSKKVLDRANTIEFSYVNLMNKAATDGQAVPLQLDNSFLKTEFLYLRDCEDQELIDNVCFNLEELNQILVKANLHVGYRVRDEISFYMMNNKKAELLTEDVAFDHEIMQKILPRVQGSSASIRKALSELFIKCAGDYTGFSGTAVYEQMDSYLESKSCKYPNSAKKIAFMMRRYEEDGFTSYWI